MLVGLVQDLTAALLHGHAHIVGQRLDALPGGLHVAPGVVAFLDVAQHIGGAGVGDGHPLAALELDADIVGGVALLGGEELQLRLLNLLRRGVNGVAQTRDVSGTGANVQNLLVAGTHHGAAGHALNLHVQGVDVGVVTAHGGVLHAGTAVLDDADVGSGAADLKVDAVGGTQVHQSAHDGSGRAGEHGQHRTLLHFVDIHNAAVAAHDHQRHVHARGADGTFGAVGGVHHLGQNGAVDGGGAGTAGQAVELGNIGGNGGHEPPAVGLGLHQHFVLDGVHAEGLGGGDDGGPVVHQLLDVLPDGFLIDLLALQVSVGGVDIAAAVEQNVAHLGLALGEHTADAAAAHGQNAHLGHVTLDQGVGSLGGGVGDEDHVLGGDAVLAQAVLEALDDACGDTQLVVVTGHDDGLADDLIGLIVQGHGLGVGAANVNADANLAMIAHGYSS